MRMPADNQKLRRVPMPISNAFIGCDVGKTTIVVFDSRSDRLRTIANQPDALAAFAAGLDTACFVVCEATGGHEALLLDALTQAGRTVHRADARKVKAFIRSHGTLGKSDAIDARALAQYGRERHASLPCWQPAEAARERLHTLVMVRRDMVAARTAWSNRQLAPGATAAMDFTTPIVACLDAQLRVIDAAIEAVIAAAQPLAQAVRCLRGIAGIGATTAAALVALMPELGTLDRRQAAALAGLAPHPNQSGRSDRYRRTRGGRPVVKQTLFMAALSAARHHPTLRMFHQRLIAKGKKPVVALVAVMRKLIVICNARLRPA